MRYYCPQVLDGRKGWLDLPELARESKKAADDLAEAFAIKFTVSTRVQRKPHGWTPENKPMPERSFGVGLNMSSQVTEARKLKE